MSAKSVHDLPLNAVLPPAVAQHLPAEQQRLRHEILTGLRQALSSRDALAIQRLLQAASTYESLGHAWDDAGWAQLVTTLLTAVETLPLSLPRRTAVLRLLHHQLKEPRDAALLAAARPDWRFWWYLMEASTALPLHNKAAERVEKSHNDLLLKTIRRLSPYWEPAAVTDLLRVASTSLVPADMRDARAVQQLDVFLPKKLALEQLPPGALSLFFAHWRGIDDMPGVDALWARIFARLGPFQDAVASAAPAASGFDWSAFIPFLHARLWRVINPAVHEAAAAFRGMPAQPRYLESGFYEGDGQYAAVRGVSSLLVELLGVVAPPPGMPDTVETIEAIMRATSPFAHPGSEQVYHWYLTVVVDLLKLLRKRLLREAGAAAADALALAPGVTAAQWEGLGWASAAAGAGPAPFAQVWAAYARAHGLPCAQPAPLSQPALLRLADALLPPLFSCLYISGGSRDYGLDILEQGMAAAYRLAPARVATQLSRFCELALSSSTVDQVHLAPTAFRLLRAVGVDCLYPLPRLASVLPALLQGALPAIDPNDAGKTVEVLDAFTVWLDSLPLVDPSEEAYAGLAPEDDATPHLPAWHPARPSQPLPGQRAFVLGPGDTILSAGLVTDPCPPSPLAAVAPPAQPVEAAALAAAQAAASELLQDASGDTAPAFTPGSGGWLHPSVWLPTPAPSPAALAAAAQAGIACGGGDGSVAAAAAAALEPAASRMFQAASASCGALTEWCFAALDRVLALLRARGAAQKNKAEDDVTAHVRYFTAGLFAAASPALHARLLARVHEWLASVACLEDAVIVRGFLTGLVANRAPAAAPKLLRSQLQAVSDDPGMSAPLRVWHAQVVAGLVTATGSVLPPFIPAVTQLVKACCAAPAATAPERKAGIKALKGALTALAVPRAAGRAPPPWTGAVLARPWAHWGQPVTPVTASARGSDGALVLDAPPPGLQAAVATWFVPGPAEAAAAAALADATAGAALARVEAWLAAHGTPGAARPAASLEALRNDLQLINALVVGGGLALADTTTAAGADEVLPVGAAGLNLVWVPAAPGEARGSLRLAAAVAPGCGGDVTPARHRIAELVATLGALLLGDANLRADAAVAKRLSKMCYTLCARRGVTFTAAKAQVAEAHQNFSAMYKDAHMMAFRAFTKRAGKAWSVTSGGNAAAAVAAGAPSPDACAALRAALAWVPKAPLMNWNSAVEPFVYHFASRLSSLVPAVPRALHWGMGSAALVLTTGGITAEALEEDEDGEAEGPAHGDFGAGGVDSVEAPEALLSSSSSSSASAASATGAAEAGAAASHSQLYMTDDVDAAAPAAAAAELAADPTGTSGIDVSMLPAGEGLPGTPTTARVAYVTVGHSPARKVPWRALDPAPAAAALGVRAVRRLAPAEYPYALLISLMAQLLHSPYEAISRLVGSHLLGVATMFPWLRRPLCAQALDRLAAMEAAAAAAAAARAPPPLLEAEDVIADLGLTLLQPAAVYNDWCLYERACMTLLGASRLTAAVRLDKQLLLTQMLMRSMLALVQSYHTRPLDPGVIPGDDRWRAFRAQLAAKVVGLMYPAGSSSSSARPELLCADGSRQPSGAPLGPSAAPHWLYECLALQAAVSCLEAVVPAPPPLLIHEPPAAAASLRAPVARLLAPPAPEAAAAAASPAGPATETLFLWALTASVSHDEALRKVAQSTLHYLVSARAMLLALAPASVPPLPAVAAALSNRVFVSQLVTAVLPSASEDPRSLQGFVAVLAGLNLGTAEVPFGAGGRSGFRTARMALWRGLVTCWPAVAPALLAAAKELVASVVASGRASSGAGPALPAAEAAASPAPDATPAASPPPAAAAGGEQGHHELTTVKARAVGGLEVGVALLWLAVRYRRPGPAVTAAEVPAALLAAAAAGSLPPLAPGTVLFDPATDADPASLGVAAGVADASAAWGTPPFPLAAATAGAPGAHDFATADALTLAVIKAVLHPLVTAGGGTAVSADDLGSGLSKALNGAHIAQYPLLARWVFGSACVALGATGSALLPPPAAPGEWGAPVPGEAPPALAAIRALLQREVLPPEAAGLKAASRNMLLLHAAGGRSGVAAAAAAPAAAASDAGAGGGFTVLGQLLRLVVVLHSEATSHRGMRLAQTGVPRRSRWESIHPFIGYEYPAGCGELKPAVEAASGAVRQLLPCLLAAVAHPFRRVRTEVGITLARVLRADPGMAHPVVPPAYDACPATALPDPWAAASPQRPEGGAPAALPLTALATRLVGHPAPAAPAAAGPPPWVAAALAVLTYCAQPIIPVLSKAVASASEVPIDVTRWAENALETLAYYALHVVQPYHRDSGVHALLAAPLLLACHPAPGSDIATLLRGAAGAVYNDTNLTTSGPDAEAYLAALYADSRRFFYQDLAPGHSAPAAAEEGEGAATAAAAAGQQPGERSGSAAPVTADTVALPLAGLEPTASSGGAAEASWTLGAMLRVCSRVARFGARPEAARSSSSGDDDDEAPAAEPGTTAPAAGGASASMTYMSSTRCAGLVALSGLGMRHFSRLTPADWEALTASINGRLRDALPETQAKAAQAASLALMVRPLAVQLAWGARYVKLLRTKVPRRVEPPVSASPAAGDGAAAAAAAAHREYRRALARATQRRLAGAYGIAAVVYAHPHDVPPGLPSLLSALAARAGESSLVGSAVKRIIGDFRRSHSDGWEANHKAAFTPAQLNDLDGVSSSVSMFT